MKKTKWILSVAMVLCFSSIISASSCCCGADDYSSGFYFGGQVGYVNTNWRNIDQNAVDNFQIVVKKDYGVGLRPFVGYQLNQNIAFEFGWTYLNKAKMDRFQQNEFQDTSLATIRTQAFDASVRLSIPVCCNAGIFTRVGLSYLHSHGSVRWRALDIEASNSNALKFSPSTYNVVFGLGAYYEFACKLRAEVSWMRFGGFTSVDDNYQPSPDFYSVGLAYRL
jgi:OOP family OmpA-OmpF porin